MNDKIILHKNSAYRYLKKFDETKQNACSSIKNIEQIKSKKFIKKAREFIKIKNKKQFQKKRIAVEYVFVDRLQRIIQKKRNESKTTKKINVHSKKKRLKQ